MSTATHSARPTPFLLQGARGQLHATYFAPTAVRHPAGDLLFVPPFAEEMNRSRAMVALQARALAALGIGTLVLDLHGTGDSEGDFVDASWATWLADLQCGVHWLRTQGQGCSTLWGLRLGAVLASQLAHEVGGIERLLLWQPVFDGKQFYTQFLRIRIAAEMAQADRIKTTGELRQRSAAGEAIEVSGYRVGPELAREIDTAVFEAGAAGSTPAIDWFDVLASAEDTMPPAAQQRVERLRGDGVALHVTTSVGPPFWQVHERELAPALIEATTARAATWGAPAQPAPSAARVAASPASATHPEQPLGFDCGDAHLTGVLHTGAPDAVCGVVIVVAGGPQYRAGAHRQFVGMARRLAHSGFPVLRFDLRGMGDSSGEHRGYKESDPDIRAAIDTLMQRQPQLRSVVLLGECESASGILFYAWRDARVQGAVLINPWVRTEEGRAQVIVRHYYTSRLVSREFWRHVLSGKFKARESFTSMIDVVRTYLRGRAQIARQTAQPEVDDLSALPLPVRVAEGLRRFRGRSLLLMSGVDFIAREFDEVTRTSKAWEGLLDNERLERVDVEGADHTFSREVWKNAAADTVTHWVERLAATPVPPRA